jgi:hypothetical protein
VLIAEMLLLTARNDKGRGPVGSGALVRAGLPGALLADLAMDGRPAVAEDQCGPGISGPAANCLPMPAMRCGSIGGAGTCGRSSGG